MAKSGRWLCGVVYCQLDNQVVVEYKNGNHLALYTVDSSNVADVAEILRSMSDRVSACGCPHRCVYCGAMRRKNNKGHWCKTINCPWHGGFAGCELRKGNK